MTRLTHVNPAHPNPRKETLPNGKKRQHTGAASAPYNFVPLPEAVVHAEPIPDQDRYHERRHTGHFDVLLTTSSPLYIRAPHDPDEFRRAQGAERGPFRERAKNKPAFFHTGSGGLPVIPGSSLRGMIRALVEIAAYAKVQRVSRQRLFYRTMDGSSVMQSYLDATTTRSRGKMEDATWPGFLFREGGRYYVRTTYKARVHRTLLTPPLYAGKEPNTHPHWASPPGTSASYQHQQVWVQLEFRDADGFDRAGDYVTALRATAPASNTDWYEGRLALTGNLQRRLPNGTLVDKTYHYVFLLPEEAKRYDPSGFEEDRLEVPDEAIAEFHGDQLTGWQEDAFAEDAPLDEARERAGWVRKNPANAKSTPPDYGDPIFFQDDGEKVTHFGRTLHYRIPYERTPLDLVPEELRREGDLDLAEALFGYVKSDEQPYGKARACAGRVAVTDAVLQGAPPPAPSSLYLSAPDGGPIVPKVLASPKPTAFQHYLVQTSDVKTELAHYGTDGAVIRGHKRYWLQGDRTRQGSAGPSPDLLPTRGEPGVNEQTGEVDPSSSQHTQMRPVRPGVTFRFRVYFENLTDVEVGALAWALRPPAASEPYPYRHSLGMGKPLGLGAVELAPSLHLGDRPARYAALFDGPAWAKPASSASVADDFAGRFEAYVLKALGRSEPSLSAVDRIRALLRLMEWPGQPANWSAPPILSTGAPNTRTMTLEEFRDRRVLPTSDAFPSGVSGRDGERRGTAGARPEPPRPAINSGSAASPSQGHPPVAGLEHGRFSGTLKRLEQGWGLIQASVETRRAIEQQGFAFDPQKPDLFAHRSQLPDDIRVGDDVSFGVSPDRKNPKQAAAQLVRKR